MAKKKAVQEEHVNHERWLITYADLITLLMVFFIVLYSMSRADVAKFARLQASLKKAFKVEVLQGDVPTSLHGDDGSSAPTSVIQEVIASSPAVVPDSRMVTTLEELRGELLRFPQAQQTNHVQIGAGRDGVAISLSGNVLFDSGRADLKPEGLVLLDALAERFRDMANELRVEGHTDNIPIETSLYPSNWELSSARATTVGRYLVERGGVRPARVIAAGYGENRPVSSNDSREGRARNRRVDIVVLFPQVPVATVAGGEVGSRGGSQP